MSDETKPVAPSGCVWGPERVRVRLSVWDNEAPWWVALAPDPDSDGRVHAFVWEGAAGWLPRYDNLTIWRAAFEAERARSDEAARAERDACRREALSYGRSSDDIAHTLAAEAIADRIAARGR